jgi:signal peptidase II
VTQEVPQESPSARRRRLDLVIGVGVVVLVLDIVTKHWAVNRLSGQRTIEVLGSLRFNLTYNTGASFSIGSDSGIGPWVGVVALVVVVALALGETSRTSWGAVAAGLIGGGAIGNLLDRAFRGDDGFMHGAVIDFIDLQWWPVFNIADMGVVVGAILLVIATLRTP